MKILGKKVVLSERWRKLIMEKLSKTRDRINTIKDLLLFLLVAVLITQFIICKSKVPSSSMEPTIMPGDRIVFNRIGAYYQKPKRGDIVIFEEGNQKLIKRLIGLPGEAIDLMDGKVYVDGVELLEEAYIGKEVRTNFIDDPRYESIRYPYTVPEDSYFFMGDNRSGSLDSRAFGAIKEDRIIAIGAYRIYPFDKIGKLE